MDRLQLATLLSWAGEGGFKGRKRLQKVVYFLKEAGCPLNCAYTLHHFGPYSRDVADRCDEMVAAGLINEKGGPATGDMEYSYSLTSEARTALAQKPDDKLRKYQARATELIRENLWTLELGSTILYIYRQTGDWDHAFKRACEFKKVPFDASASQAALALAKQFEKRVAN